MEARIAQLEAKVAEQERQIAELLKVVKSKPAPFPPTTSPQPAASKQHPKSRVKTK